MNKTFELPEIKSFLGTVIGEVEAFDYQSKSKGIQQTGYNIPFLDHTNTPNILVSFEDVSDLPVNSRVMIQAEDRKQGVTGYIQEKVLPTDEDQWSAHTSSGLVVRKVMIMNKPAVVKVEPVEEPTTKKK